MKKDYLLPRERILESLALQEPGRVPWDELEVDQRIVDVILGRAHTSVDKPLGYYNREVEEEKAFSRRVGKDNITFSFCPPIFCDPSRGEDGLFFYGKGHIQSRDDLKKNGRKGERNYELDRRLERICENIGSRFCQFLFY